MTSLAFVFFLFHLSSVEGSTPNAMQQQNPHYLTLLETLFCELQARTHFARPNWKSVFSRLAATHQDARIGMLFMPHQFSHIHSGTSGTLISFVQLWWCMIGRCVRHWQQEVFVFGVYRSFLLRPSSTSKGVGSFVQDVLPEINHKVRVPQGELLRDATDGWLDRWIGRWLALDL